MFLIKQFLKVKSINIANTLAVQCRVHRDALGLKRCLLFSREMTADWLGHSAKSVFPCWVQVLWERFHHGVWVGKEMIQMPLGNTSWRKKWQSLLDLSKCVSSPSERARTRVQMREKAWKVPVSKWSLLFVWWRDYE